MWSKLHKDNIIDKDKIMVDRFNSWVGMKFQLIRIRLSTISEWIDNDHIRVRGGAGI